MWLLDEWAERHIADAQQKGELDKLPGMGAPLILDDDSAVPAELRSGFRLLKNAGYLPPELEVRKEALTLARLLQGINSEHPDFDELNKRMALLAFRLRQAGMSTDFLHGEYQAALSGKFSTEDK
ncbi:DUF1992 domain-containing protein [Serratia odorifera]|jgi:hypothetical protein|uniref:DnaJ homologue subfamily C member 28 conserved domain-containing protein n=2 Tax=Serratia odorifera TaxID=618 RepID=D4DYD5_SEROD|nr:DUF1992 domain-containing protein [Serratia odorifera]EFE97410.1 hypothetical protein HMPREF0758_0935 [Serratia odorifera DSM 4582]MBJ2068044.1 DUF1992 domain-containing protein [Serratia odorifera]PNK82491.1 DUF1992 domain-containing protein [Serratia odorifera]PNK91918.1 DUF1992 domain-containing protein [Serratia odorifera]RII73038.1 DUF1992 domain-containing protein [Serratia odorifera]